jgi:hypothetical protein
VADTYYINAQRAGTTTAGTYQLAIWLENTSTAPLTGGVLTGEGAAANGTIATAENASSSWRAVQYQSTIDGSISAGDSDYFKYQFNAGDLVTILMDSTSALDARVNLRDSTGTIIALENGTSTGPSLDSPIYAYRVATGGTYYLETSAASGTGSYSAIVYLSSTSPLPALKSGDDYYRITLETGDAISFALDGQTVGTLNLELFDAGGVSLATGMTGPTNFDSLIRYSAAATGNYFLRVNGSPNLPYYLSVVVGAEFDTESNDTFGTAQLLTVGKALGGISGNDDWYRFSATPGQLLTLTTSTRGDAAGEFINNLDPLIELYDPNNVLLGSDDDSAGDGHNAMLTKAATIAGEYRVRMIGAGSTSGEYTLSLNVNNDPPPQISSVVIDDGTAQRSLVRSLTVTFNEPVNLPGTPTTAFQLTRTGPTPPTGDVTMALDSFTGQTTAKFSFSGSFTEFGSLVDGLYTLTIFGNQITDSAGQPLDGDNNPGTVGGDYVLNLHRLFGDGDGNRTVNSVDFAALRTFFGLPGGSMFDFNNDTITDSNDFAAFRARFGLMI